MACAGAFSSGSATDASTDGAKPADNVSTSTAVSSVSCIATTAFRTATSSTPGGPRPLPDPPAIPPPPAPRSRANPSRGPAMVRRQAIGGGADTCTADAGLGGTHYHAIRLLAGLRLPRFIA